MSTYCDACGHLMTEHQDYLYRCPSCNFLISNLRSGAGRGIDGLEFLRRQNFRILCDRLEKIRPLNKCNILEIGSAEGWFLEEARKRGMTVMGIEPSYEHAQMAIRKDFSILNGYFPDCSVAYTKFDFIIFNDSFEHLPDRVEAIKECENLLVKDGHLILNLPTSSGFFYKISSFLANIGYKKYLNRLWQVGLPSPHLSYFDQRNISRFIKRHTYLTHARSLRLESLSAKDIHKRIGFTHKGAVRTLISIAIILSLPILRILPSDTMVEIFKKTR